MNSALFKVLYAVPYRSLHDFSLRQFIEVSMDRSIYNHMLYLCSIRKAYIYILDIKAIGCIEGTDQL